MARQLILNSYKGGGVVDTTPLFFIEASFSESLK